MADINQIIAGGAGAGTTADFSGIPKILDAYYKGRDEAAKNDLRDAFKDGVPLTPDGQPDFPAMAKIFFQKGGTEQGIAASNLGLQQQKIKYGQDTDATVNPSPNGGQSSVVSPPSINRSGSTVVAPPLNRNGSGPPQDGQPPQAAQGQGSVGTLAQALTAQGIPNDQIEGASAAIARQLGLPDPKAQINFSDPQIRNVVLPAIAQMKRMGVGQVQPPQAGDNPPQPQPPNTQGAQQPQPVAQMAPQQPQQPQPQVAQAAPQMQPQAVPPQSGATDPRFVGLVPAGRTPDQQIHLLQRAIDSGLLAPEQTRSYQNAVDAIRKAAEPTAEEKSFYASKRNPGIDERAAQQKADEAHATGVAQSDIKEQDGIISAGAAARQRLATLNTISNIIDTDKNMTLGFGAETSLKVKKALESIGVNVGDLSGPQAIQKLNGLLASESAKGVSARPAQFEFKTFLTNNPGLDLDKAGNQRVIGIFSQLAKRDVDLGKLARQTRDDWQNWDNVVENYDKQNPIRDPVSGKPITTNSIVAPGPTKASTSAPMPGARKAPDGNWYVADPNRPGKFAKVVQ